MHSRAGTGWRVQQDGTGTVPGLLLPRQPATQHCCCIRKFSPEVLGVSPGLKGMWMAAWKASQPHDVDRQGWEGMPHRGGDLLARLQGVVRRGAKGPPAEHDWAAPLRRCQSRRCGDNNGVLHALSSALLQQDGTFCSSNRTVQKVPGLLLEVCCDDLLS